MYMTKKRIIGGVVHEVPDDLCKVIVSKKSVKEMWEGLTPLARNEWICWVISNKKPETRVNHLKRVPEDLLKGKRRPCCWVGCMHREKNLSQATNQVVA